MKTIALLSQKGGVGKTTLALHLAVGWTQRGVNVALIDIDPQVSAAKWGDRREAVLPVVRAVPEKRLPQELETIRRAGGEVAVIDTAPRADAVILEVGEIADLVVIPCRPSILDFEALADTLKLVRTTGVPILTVLNAVVPHVSDTELAADAIAQLGAAVCPVRIHRRVAFARALIEGRTAQEVEPAGKAAAEIEELFRVVNEQIRPAATAAMGGEGDA